MFSKIKTLNIGQYKGFKDFKLDFNENLIVLVGENGTGKTTLLEIIYNLLSGNNEFFEDDPNLMNITLELKDGIKIRADREEKDVNLYINDKLVNEDNEFFTEQRAIYFPSEVAFKSYEMTGPNKMELSNTDVILNADKMSKELKQFLINQKYQDLNDIANGKSDEAIRIEKYKKLYNDFLTDKKFIGIDNESFEPIFELNDTGEVISIDKLSSGEKQIFFKGGSLLQYGEEKEIVVLLDEPETSMHPEWQQKILKFYRDIVPKAQFIFATHSPHILSCCKKEEICVIEKVQNNLCLKEDFENPYGQKDEDILFNIFNLESVRNLDIQKELDEYKKLFCKKELLSEEEKETMKILREKLQKSGGLTKSDISLLEFESNTSRFKEKFEELRAKTQK